MVTLVPARAPDADTITEERRWLALGGGVTGTCLGIALQWSNGVLVPAALALVVLAFVLGAVAAAIARPAWLARMDARAVRVVALTAFAIHLGYLYTALPGLYLRLGPDGVRPFHLGVTVLAIVGASAA